MKILSDLYSEVNRLFIAGSRFAPGDMRIAKLLPQLQQMGEKSPVMKRLADMTEDMLNSSEPEAALPDLGIFLLAIMNTQGNICTENLTEQENIAFFNELPYTTVPYSTLEPSITALTTTGQGRYDIIENAFEAGNLNDFRLYSHIANGLEDKFSELANYMGTVVIKSMGEQMIPFLLRDLDIKGKKKSNGVRLELLDTLNYEHIITLAEEALSEGSPVVKVEALKILGRDSAYEELLLTYTEDKKDVIKEAALIGLVRMDSAKGYEKFLKILQSKQFDPAINAIRYCKNPNYIDEITDIIADKFENNDGTLSMLSFAVNNMGESYSHEAAVKIYERIFNTPVFKTRYEFIQHYFFQAKHVYTPEQICEVFVSFYAANNSRLFNYECMEIALNSNKKSMALNYLKLYFNKQWSANYTYYQAAYLLAKHMDGKDLDFVAKGLYEVLTKKDGSVYTAAYYAEEFIFRYHPELVNKIFKESGSYELLKQLKNLHAYDLKMQYNCRNFAELLQNY